MSETRDIHEEEALGRSYDARLMRRLLGYLAPHRVRMVAAVSPNEVTSKSMFDAIMRAAEF